MAYDLTGEMRFVDEDFLALWKIFDDEVRMLLVTPAGRECDVMITKIEVSTTGGLIEISSAGQWRDHQPKVIETGEAGS